MNLQVEIRLISLNSQFSTEPTNDINTLLEECSSRDTYELEKKRIKRSKYKNENVMNDVNMQYVESYYDLVDEILDEMCHTLPLMPACDNRR